MRIGFFISCDNLYTKCAEVLLKSILINSPGFNYDFNISCGNNLDWDHRKELTNVYPVIFRDYKNNDEYIKHNKAPLQFRSMELFKMQEYDYVVQLGADALCINSVQPIIDTCESGEITDVGMPYEKRRPDMFSSGIMIINKKYLNMETYKKLMKADYSKVNMFGRDMKLYNCFFKKKIKEVPYEFDMLNSEIEYYHQIKDCIFFHYAHKPQATRGKCAQWIYDLWDKYNAYSLKDINEGLIKSEFNEEVKDGDS